MKQFFDFLFTTLSLLILLPVLIIVWILCSLDTNSNGIFMQERIGKYGRTFMIYKFRTISISSNNISELGYKVRQFKLDELPQLINVLKGDMSIVGPRPDIPGFADLLEGENRLILDLKPGITGPASLKYFDEEKLLKSVEDPEKFSKKVIFPDKVKINLDYYYKRSFLGDLKIILQTFLRYISKKTNYEEK
ncbi:sugar transferase [Pseudotenacibaculum sp. MALMAid0570]|uniref:sugar transferase n=1 Tax=Pseudotenacibaculum sp. MALMAid0570 TaxID=3143938 RepID=UPI0032DFE40B